MKLQAEQWWGGALEPQWGFLPEFTPLEQGKEKEEGEKPSRLEKICNGVVLWCD